MIDTHCHLDMPRFDGDRAAVLERAWSAGLTGLIVPAVAPSTWEALLEWPARDARVQVGLGIHPQFLPELDERDDEKHLAFLDSLLSRGSAIAVGECGLDGPTKAVVPMERQVRIVRAHFALARKHRLPMLMHCLRAHPELLELLKTEPLPEAGLLMHSYSGSADLTKKYVKYGCHFSFAGPVSFAEARRPIDALKSVPLERLLAETDAPDQAPHPHRGQRSEPAFLPLIVEAMARGRGEPLEVTRDAMLANTKRLFPVFQGTQNAFMASSSRA
ncbi:MAG: TatD family hydrolase [Myxococcales bacterium]|nr:TatD family hydrolase [Myxococcales bacterium]